ncbi:MAG: histidine kinase N-terminal 7TM domain-containing protein, partial [Spirochaetales bacterium]|nr:histidine kinase N-terminal 7TM domain-containing protein [Spirochaetales bacterium]
MSIILIFKILTLASCIISSILVVLTISRRKESSPLKYYFLLMIAISVYSISYLFEISMPRLEWSIYCLNFEYIGLSCIPICWILIAWSYSPYDIDKDKKTKNYLYLLFIISLVVSLAVWTNPLHHLIYKDISLIKTPYNITILKYDRAFGFWVANIMLVALYLIG